MVAEQAGSIPVTIHDVDVSRHQGHHPGTRAYRRVVGSLFAAGLATFALLYDTQAVLPELADEFGVSAARSTLAVSLTTVGLAAALLVTGPWSDRVGRTRLIHLSLAGSSVVALACAVAPTWEALAVLRLVQGVTLAGLPAVATAYLREELHPSSHARAAGLYIAGTALGGAAGRLVTGPAAEAWGWRWGLGTTAVLAVACTVVVGLLLPRSRRFEPRTGGIAAILSSGRAALADPALRSLFVIGGCSVGSLVAVFNVLGFRLAGAPFGLGVGAVSLLFLVYPLGSLSSAVSGRLADRVGRRAVVPVGAATAVAGLLLTLPDRLPLIALGLAVLAVGFFAVHGVASGWVPVRAHAGGMSAGQAASLYLVSYYVGSSVFGSLAATAYDLAHWPGVVTLGATLWAGVACAVHVLRRTPSLLP
jgi:YNFM family putative membrane transporter